MSTFTVERLLADRPAFHHRETEIHRPFELSESFLEPAIAKQIASDGNACYAVAPEVLRFIEDSVSKKKQDAGNGRGP